MALLQATDENFNELKKDGIAIVDFYSTHCGPCRLLLPTLLKIESDMPFIKLIKVNTDECPRLAEEYKIYSLPTVYLSKDGNMAEYQQEYDEDIIKQAIGALLYD